MRLFTGAPAADGILVTSFAVDDVETEAERLRDLGVPSPGRPWPWDP
jgi:hypothetical protein